MKTLITNTFRLFGLLITLIAAMIYNAQGQTTLTLGDVTFDAATGTIPIIQQAIPTLLSLLHLMLMGKMLVLPQLDMEHFLIIA